MSGIELRFGAYLLAAAATVAATTYGTDARAQTPPYYQPQPQQQPMDPAALPPQQQPGMQQQQAMQQQPMQQQPMQQQPGMQQQPMQQPMIMQPGTGVSYPGGVVVVGPAPRTLDWEPGESIPQGYRPTTRVRTNLVVAGAVTFGSTWLAGGLIPGSIAIEANVNGAEALMFPVFGPFIGIGTMSPSFLGGFWLGIDGLAQASGVALFVAGFLAPKHELVRTDVIGKTEVKWMPTPIALGHGAQGMGVTGTF